MARNMWRLPFLLNSSLLADMAFGMAEAVSDDEFIVWGGQVNNFKLNDMCLLVETLVRVPSLQHQCMRVLAAHSAVCVNTPSDVMGLIEAHRAVQVTDLFDAESVRAARMRQWTHRRLGLQLPHGAEQRNDFFDDDDEDEDADSDE